MLYSDGINREQEFKKRLEELKGSIEKLDEKYYIKEELTKKSTINWVSKLSMGHEDLCKELANCAHTISNLDEKQEEAIEFCCNLPKIWV